MKDPFNVFPPVKIKGLLFILFVLYHLCLCQVKSPLFPGKAKTPSFKTTEEESSFKGSKYVTVDEFEAMKDQFQDQLSDLKKELSELKSGRAKKK